MSKNLNYLILVIILVGGTVWYLKGSKPEATGEPMAEVLVPQLTSEEQEGKALFAENCSSCHGDNAEGRQGFAPSLVHTYYKPSHHADIAFQLAAKNGVRQHHWTFGDMPRVEGVDESDLTLIISYIRKLQVTNGIE